MNTSPTSPFVVAREAYVKNMLAKGYSVTVIPIVSEQDLAPRSRASETLKNLHLTGDAKIVIEGHGAPGDDYISSDNKSGHKVDYSAQHLSDFISRNMPEVDSVQVSVAACSSGLGKFQNPDNFNERTQSFAEHLMKALHKNNIKSAVKGRNGKISIQATGKENIQDPKYSYNRDTREKEEAQLKAELDILNSKIISHGAEADRLRNDAISILESITPGADPTSTEAKLSKVATLSAKSQWFDDEYEKLDNRASDINAKLEEIHDEIMAEFKDFNQESSATITYSHYHNKGRLMQFDAIQKNEFLGSLGEMEIKLKANKEALRKSIEKQKARHKEWQELLEGAQEGSRLYGSQTLHIQVTSFEKRVAVSQGLQDRLQKELVEIERKLAKTTETKLAFQAGTVFQDEMSIPDVTNTLNEIEVILHGGITNCYPDSTRY